MMTEIPLTDVERNDRDDDDDNGRRPPSSSSTLSSNRARHSDATTNDSDDKDKMRGYRPLAIRYTKRDGSIGECDLGCGCDLKDFVIILSFYVVFYGFLSFFFALLLRGAIDTSSTSTLLWAFFVLGVFFVVMMAGAISLGTKEVEKERKERQSGEAKAECSNGKMEV